MKILDITLCSDSARQIAEDFQRSVVGQETAKQSLINIIEKYQAGLCDPTRPIGNLLFLGNTGCGKTHLVETLCKSLFGNKRACIKIDCAEFQHSHEIAKLVGSPAGYLGHRETSPMLTNAALSKYHTEKLKFSVLLLDEIEKASDALWNLLLGILDKATLTTGTNEVVDFKDVIIVMTSNVGSKDMSRLMDGGMGFAKQDILDAIVDSQVDDAAKAAAKRKFSPEFINRIDETVVFHTLTEDQIKDILSIELGNLQQHILSVSKIKFFFHVRGDAKKVLLSEGYNRSYGARHLKRTIERRIVAPVSRLLASEQILDKDVVLINEVGKPDFEFSVSESTYEAKA